MAQRTGPQFDPQPGDVMTFHTTEVVYTVTRRDSTDVHIDAVTPEGERCYYVRSVAWWSADCGGAFTYARPAPAPVPAAAPPFPTAAVLRALADAARAYGDPGGGEGDPILYTLLDKVDTLVGVRSSWDAVANALVDAADVLEVPRAV